MKTLLVVTAWFEALTGVALMASPATPVSLLIGATLDAPAGLVAARVAGAALLALGLACWEARDDERSRAARGVVRAMLLYNVGAATILVYSSLGLGLAGFGLWPAVILHLALAAWCTACLRGTSPGAGRAAEAKAPSIEERS